ncbi:MAG: hypothetical protein LBJ76_05570 [Candidatus Accumulibacter sp.]|nr:hypothetical protein [Accumulibacter sp.]
MRESAHREQKGDGEHGKHGFFHGNPHSIEIRPLGGVLRIVSIARFLYTAIEIDVGFFETQGGMPVHFHAHS